MKKKFSTVCVGMMFLIGMGLLLYPSVSNWVNQYTQSRVAQSYRQNVEDMTEKDYTEYLEAAKQHNEKIAQAGSLAAAVSMEKENMEEYESLLNLKGNGVMGILRIPRFEVFLPIYHTTKDNVLQSGLGHYVGSSLPVGGAGTHCVVSGHTGLPSAKLLTDLDQMKNGDQFYIDVLGDTLAYEVYDIRKVLPREVDSLDVSPEKDEVTIVTCTPYGINSHRLLVTGKRIPYIPEEEPEAESVMEKMHRINERTVKIFIFAVVVFAIAIAAGTICGNMSSKKSRENGRKKE